MDGVWVRETGGDTVLVFVHGILSDSQACWRHPDGAWWPQLARDDPSLAQVSIYTFSYHTGVFSGSYGISDVVDALKEHLHLDKVLRRRSIVFVCHGMGGIVVRRYLVARQVELIEQARDIGLFLVASPSLGSRYADWISGLAQWVGQSQAEGLRFVTGNPWLADLDKDFKNLKEGGRLWIRGKELVEHRFLVASKLFRKQVVEPFSGAVYFGEPFKVADSDHSSIAKPASVGAIQHRLLVDFVLDGSTDPSPGRADGAQAPVEPDASSVPQMSGPVDRPEALPLAELLQRICSSDPLIALPAARTLAGIDDAIDAILDRPQRSNERVPLEAVHLALRGKRAAAHALTARVLDDAGGWHRGLGAAFDFDVSHRAQGADPLGAALADSDRDRARLIYWALGHLGALEWGWTIRRHFEALDDREAGSYAGMAVDATAALFRHARGQLDVNSASTLLIDMLTLDAKRNSSGYMALSIRHALESPTGDHVSVLSHDWAKSGQPLIRRIAADALGDARIRRAMPVLERLLGDADASVRNAASQALGAMETKAALQILLKSAPESDGVAFALYLHDDDTEFERIGMDFLDEGRFAGWAVARAAGRRRALSFAGRLREMLHDDSYMQRGAALLALARMGDPVDHERIEDGWAESTSASFERVMATLAVLVISPSRYEELEAGLRRDLADSHHFWQPARTDIIDVLESLQIDAANRLAAAWKPFYAGYRTGR